MASAKDPQPTEVVYGLELTASFAINSIAFHSLASKCRRSGVLDAISNIKSTKPVADPVSITGPDEDLNTRLDNRGESIQEGTRI